MKKVLTISFMFMTVLLVSSSGYSQDTTTAVQPESAVTVAFDSSKATSKWDLTLNFSGRKVTGYTEYHIQYPIVYYSAFPGVGHSILAFPLDGYRMEASGLLNLKAFKKDTIVFELAFSKALTTPKEAQVDTDYDYVSAFMPPQWLWAATKSDVKYSNYDLRFTAGYPFWLKKQVKMTPVLGFQTSHNSYDVIGLSGWWEYYYGEKILIEPEDYAGIKVGTYTVDYHQLITGLIIETAPNKGLSFYLKGNYLPYVIAKDLDNHIFRYKESTTNATGSGYQLEGKIKIQIHKFISGATLNWGGGVNMLRITAKGSQIQEWYGDDPASDDFDDTGSVSSPIDNTLKLRQNSFIAFFEYKL